MTTNLTARNLLTLGHAIRAVSEDYSNGKPGHGDFVRVVAEHIGGCEHLVDRAANLTYDAECCGPRLAEYVLLIEHGLHLAEKVSHVESERGLGLVCGWCYDTFAPSDEFGMGEAQPFCSEDCANEFVASAPWLPEGHRSAPLVP